MDLVLPPVPSSALDHWETVRRARIDELYGAHESVGGRGPGRRTATEQLNWALTLRLSGEFQGYVRDLHDEAVEVVMARSYRLTAELESVINNLLTLNRQISTKNPTASTLQQDFARFGFRVLDEVKARYRRGERWLKVLEDLNRARNGVAHADTIKIAQVTGGRSLVLSMVKQWDGSLRSLSRALDRITSEKLAVLTGGRPPW